MKRLPMIWKWFLFEKRLPMIQNYDLNILECWIIIFTFIWTYIYTNLLYLHYFSSLAIFSSFLNAFFFGVPWLSLYLFTISLVNEKHLTVTYNLTTFSRHKDWHSFEVSTTQFSIMLHHKCFTREEVITLFTIVSTGRRVIVFICVLPK